jgi:hypothetical protein
MVTALLSRLAHFWVTLSYALSLAVISVALSRFDPALQNRVIEAASTNLDNLSRGHVDTLVTSAFIADAGPEWEWVPGLVFLLAIGELLWGSKRLAVTLIVGQIGATLLVAGWLVVAVDRGWLPVDVASEADVGMSYCVVGVLGALSPAIPRPWRLAWSGWWVGVAIYVVAVNTDFAYLGHLFALLIGMLAATRFGMPRPWTAVKLALLLLGSIFGYLVLCNDVPLAVAALAGCVGAMVGVVVTLLATAVESGRTERASRAEGSDQTNCSAEASIQSERHDSGGSSSNSPGISQS